MKVKLQEPEFAKFIYINPNNDHVHLMMPVVSGQNIGLDNTCKSTFELQNFFGKNDGDGAIDELLKYKRALESDIEWIQNDPILIEQKQNRLDQINSYIDTINAMSSSSEISELDAGIMANYPKALVSLMEERSNLYSMVLRPTKMDSQLKSVNPIFSVRRQTTDDKDDPSILYTTLKSVYTQPTNTAEADLQALLKQTVLKSLEQALLKPENKNKKEFALIQDELTKQCEQLFAVNVNFNMPITDKYLVFKKELSSDEFQTYLSDMLGCTETDEYVDALINMCARNMWDTIPKSPFSELTADKYKEKTPGIVEEFADKCSILTQFFMAQTNVSCFAKGLSTANFGEKLDDSEELSKGLADCVKGALEEGIPVEDAMLSFVNNNHEKFGLQQELTTSDMNKIKQQFMYNYILIKNSPHFDEFILLDTDKPGKFVTHQTRICTDLSEIIGRGFPNLDNPYFQQTRDDFMSLTQKNYGRFNHLNESVVAKIDLDPNLIKDGSQLVFVINQFKTSEEIESILSSVKDRLPQLIENVSSMLGVLKKLNTTQSQLLLLQTLGSDYLDSFITKKEQFIDVLHTVNPSNQIVLIEMLSPIHIKSFNKRGFEFLNTVEQLKTPEAQVTLFTKLGGEHLATVINNEVALNKVMSALKSPESKRALIEKLGASHIQSIVQDERRCANILDKFETIAIDGAPEKVSRNTPIDLFKATNMTSAFKDELQKLRGVEPEPGSQVNSLSN